MDGETIRLIIAVGILVSLFIVSALLGSIVIADFRVRRFRGGDQRPRPAAELGAAEDSDAMATLDRLPRDGAAGELPLERVFRIVSWTFLLVSVVIVAASRMWRETLEQLVILVAVSGGFLLLIYDVLPGRVARSVRAVLLALVAVTFATLLVLSTGGYESPFFFTFPLIVGAAALAVAPLAALALGLLAAAGYLLAATAATGVPSATQVVSSAVTLTGLFLLASVAAAVAREQRRARDAALRLSALDSLTGLYNRPFFFTALEREIARSNRSGRGFCVVMLDLDGLKETNDRLGHHVGDAVLRAVAETVRSGVRKVDVASRYGGDEFAALLPETDPTGGWVVAEKIRLGVREQGVPGLDSRPTVSVGVVSYPTDGRTAEGLMINADRAMYVSKRGGGNQVSGAAREPTVVPMESERRR